VRLPRELQGYQEMVMKTSAEIQETSLKTNVAMEFMALLCEGMRLGQNNELKKRKFRTTRR
jgi:hypothetical protein